MYTCQQVLRPQVQVQVLGPQVQVLQTIMYSRTSTSTKYTSLVFASARPMPSCGLFVRCLSVRPSCSIRMNKCIKNFLPSGTSSHTIIVFPYQTLWQYSQQISGYWTDDCWSVINN